MENLFVIIWVKGTYINNIQINIFDKIDKINHQLTASEILWASATDAPALEVCFNLAALCGQHWTYGATFQPAVHGVPLQAIRMQLNAPMMDRITFILSI